MHDCECSEEYGPCEDHCEILVSRDGGNSRTADELAAVFASDVADLYEWRGKDRPTGDAYLLAEDFWRAIEIERAKGGYYSSWAPESGRIVRDDGSVYEWADHDMSQHLSDAMLNLESDLGDLGLSAAWEDGYTIYETADDCPLLG